MFSKNFRITLNLSNFFHDHRSRTRIFINDDIQTIHDIEKRIEKTFHIKNFHLTSQNEFLPPSEDVRILKQDDIIWVMHNGNDCESCSPELVTKKKGKRARTANRSMSSTEEYVEEQLRSPKKKKKKKCQPEPCEENVTQISSLSESPEKKQKRLLEDAVSKVNVTKKDKKIKKTNVGDSNLQTSTTLEETQYKRSNITINTLLPVLQSHISTYNKKFSSQLNEATSALEVSSLTKVTKKEKEIEKKIDNIKNKQYWDKESLPVYKKAIKIPTITDRYLQKTKINIIGIDHFLTDLVNAGGSNNENSLISENQNKSTVEVIHDNELSIAHFPPPEDTIVQSTSKNVDTEVKEHVSKSNDENLPNHETNKISNLAEENLQENSKYAAIVNKSITSDISVKMYLPSEEDSIRSLMFRGDVSCKSHKKKHPKESNLKSFSPNVSTSFVADDIFCSQEIPPLENVAPEVKQAEELLTFTIGETKEPDVPPQEKYSFEETITRIEATPKSTSLWENPSDLSDVNHENLPSESGYFGGDDMRHPKNPPNGNTGSDMDTTKNVSVSCSDSKSTFTKRLSGVGELLEELRNNSSLMYEGKVDSDSSDFITKRRRKRVRKRRKKKDINIDTSQNDFSLVSNDAFTPKLKPEPKPMNTKARPSIHIKFVEEDTYEVAETKKNGNHYITDESLVEMSDYDLDVDSNGPSALLSLQIKEEDILKAPLMKDIMLPKVGDVIAFKIYGPTPDSTTELSSYITGRVLEFHSEDKHLLFEIIYGLHLCEALSENQIENRRCKMFWENLIEPRLIYP